jgi:ATP synthase protein I
MTPDEITARATELRKHTEEPDAVEKPITHNGMAIRIAVELVAAICAGSAIGWFMDDWLGTSPVFLLICLLLGTVAGFVTIKRINDAFAESLEKSDV